MNKFWIPALLATAVFSANAFADHDCDDDARYERHYRHSVKREIVYEEPEVVYQEAPPVVYRERIVYRDRPANYEPEERYYERPRAYASYDERPEPYPRYDGNRAIGQVVGAVAGGVIGNQVGRGRGRVAATEIGRAHV